MTRLTRSGLVLLGLLAAQPSSRADDPLPAGVTVGVVASRLNGLPAESLKVLGSPLRKFFASRAGVAGGDIVPAADPFDLADRLADGRCRLGVFHGYEFAWVKEKHPGLEPLAVTTYVTGQPRACVVVRADGPATRLGDLSAQEVTVPAGTRGHCLLFLARERAGLPATTAAPKPPAGTPEEALDAVVSGEAPAALMDAAAVAGFRNLRPGSARRLRVLCESEAFPPNVIAYSPKGLPADTAARLREALVSAHTVPTGRPLVLLWGITRFEPAPQNYAAQLTAITKTYPAPRPDAATTPTTSDSR